MESVLILCRDELPENPQDIFDERVKIAANIIQQQSHLALSVEDIAKHCGLSASRLSQLFKAQMGTSLIRWRDQIRMQKACELLARSSKSIGDIAESVGYSDQLHFTKRFRICIGCTPTEYRGKHELR